MWRRSRHRWAGSCGSDGMPAPGSGGPSALPRRRHRLSVQGRPRRVIAVLAVRVPHRTAPLRGSAQRQAGTPREPRTCSGSPRPALAKGRPRPFPPNGSRGHLESAQCVGVAEMRGDHMDRNAGHQEHGRVASVVERSPRALLSPRCYWASVVHRGGLNNRFRREHGPKCA